MISAAVAASATAVTSYSPPPTSTAAAASASFLSNLYHCPDQFRAEGCEALSLFNNNLNHLAMKALIFKWDVQAEKIPGCECEGC